MLFIGMDWPAREREREGGEMCGERKISERVPAAELESKESKEGWALGYSWTVAEDSSIVDGQGQMQPLAPRSNRPHCSILPVGKPHEETEMSQESRGEAGSRATCHGSLLPSAINSATESSNEAPAGLAARPVLLLSCSVLG